MNDERADLYLALAEALGEPPAWLSRPGKAWPLSVTVAALAPVSAAATAALPALLQVGAESLAVRRERYQALSSRPGRPHFWWYESLYGSGRLLGPETEAVGCLYATAGLQISDGELPDHASLELAFLAYLARQPSLDPAHAGRWRRLERLFIKNHAGRWLPQLGRSLIATDDAVYAPIGRLLAGWLEEMARRPNRRRRARALPHVREADCTLCGFCVQVCPSRALVIAEDARETVLSLLADRCSGCGRCARTCEAGAMTMGVEHTVVEGEQPQTLRRSPRVPCPACARPTVSRAELDFVAGQLGQSAWLEYCLACRATAGGRL